MEITRHELDDRAFTLIAMADRMRLPWQRNVAGLADDPVAMIGYLAEVLDLDLRLALDPLTDVSVLRPS